MRVLKEEINLEHFILEKSVDRKIIVQDIGLTVFLNCLAVS
jgi:hypothetical protein